MSPQYALVKVPPGKDENPLGPAELRIPHLGHCVHANLVYILGEKEALAQETWAYVEGRKQERVWI